MSKLLKVLNPAVTQYKDRRFEGTEGDWEHAIATSATVYIGNLAFFTREEQIYDIFSRVGHVRRVVMGLDKHAKTPCGFAFVAYYTRADAEASVVFLNGTLLDDRPIRVDIDWGFMDGRQYGRGRSGGQVRDEYRQDYDPGRGGYGKIIQREMMTDLGDGMAQESQHGQYRGGKRQRLEGGRHPQGGEVEAEPEPEPDAGAEVQQAHEGGEGMQHDGAGYEGEQGGGGYGGGGGEEEAGGGGGGGGAGGPIAENPRFRPESDDEA